LGLDPFNIECQINYNEISHDHTLMEAQPRLFRQGGQRFIYVTELKTGLERAIRGPFS